MHFGRQAEIIILCSSKVVDLVCAYGGFFMGDIMKG